MAYINKLCNPTPFPVSIDWDRGIVIEVEPDSSTEVTSRQAEQFMPGEPGSEEIRKMLETYGVYLQDSDRDTDVQALMALKLCWKAKNERYESAVELLVKSHVDRGIDADLEAPAFKKKLAHMGLERLKEDMVKLQARINIYEKVIEVEEFHEERAPVMDPKRTIYVLDPPREFPTILAMEIFLAENPDIAHQHADDLAFKEKANVTEDTVQEL